MLLAPPSLKKGDKIAIISTARKISISEISVAIQQMESWGLGVEIGKTIGASDNQYAGADDFRAADFQHYLDREDIKAIIMGRGGYGTVRIIDKIDFNKFVKRPKWIIGYSDYTLLHNYINQFYGIQTLHATMPINFATNTAEAIETLRKSLFGESLSYSFESRVVNPQAAIEGILTGGNLSILYSLLGTSNSINFDNKIVAIEDIGEYLYHIDRMMLALKAGRKLNTLRALVVGGMTEMNDNAIPFGKTPEQIIEEHTNQFGYPILFGAPIGHIPNNLAYKFGTEVKIQISNNLVTIAQK